MVKNPPAKHETRVLFLGQEDPLEKEMTIHSSILTGEFYGQRSLAGYNPCSPELDKTERVTQSKIILSLIGIN